MTLYHPDFLKHCKELQMKSGCSRWTLSRSSYLPFSLHPGVNAIVLGLAGHVNISAITTITPEPPIQAARSDKGQAQRALSQLFSSLAEQ